MKLNIFDIIRNGEPSIEASVVDENLVLLFPDGAKIIIPPESMLMEGGMISIIPKGILLIEPGKEAVPVEWTPEQLQNDSLEVSLAVGFETNNGEAGQLDAILQFQASWLDSDHPFAPLPEFGRPPLPWHDIDGFSIPKLELSISDEGLSRGIPDDLGDFDSTNAVVASGTLNLVGQVDSVTLNILSPDITSGGVALKWSGTGSQKLVGSVDGKPVIIATITNEGVFTVYQVGPIDHSGQGEDVLPIDFSVSIQTGSFVTEAKATVRVEDDSPFVNAAPVSSGSKLTLDESPLGTDLDGPGATVGLNSVSTNLSGNFSIAYGADGPGGESSFGLALSAQNISSGLYSLQSGDNSTTDGDGYGQGAEILLSQVGNVITGSANGIEYFTIEVDPNSGEVTFTQLESIWHPNAADSDDIAAIVTNRPGDLQVIQTATDGDGDVFVGRINLGSNFFQIEDDGPIGGVTASQTATLVLDETNLGSTATNTVIADLSGNFTANYGADGEGAIATGSFELLVNGQNVTSGLFGIDQTDQSSLDGDGFGQGSEILLTNHSGTIVGSADGVDYFTIEVNANTGQLSFNQLESIWHPDSGNGNESQTLTTQSAGQIQIVSLVTDGDGDVSTSAIDLGNGVFQINDDAPTISLDATQDSTFIVDESDIDSSSGYTSVSRDLSNNFNIDFGEDGAGTSSYQFDLNGTNVSSGLYTSQAGDVSSADGDGFGQGAEILMSQSGNTITGAAGGVDYFTIELNSSTGVTTFTQLQPIWHPDTSDADDITGIITPSAGDLQITQIITDADGDSASASIDLGANQFRIEDDGPDVSVALQGGANITVDESALGSVTVPGSTLFTTTVAVGQDSANSATSFSLEVTGGGNSGLYLTGSSEEIILVDNAGVIEAREGGAGGTLAFTVSIDGTSGDITLDQIESLAHPDNANFDDSIFLANGSLNAVVTSTDGDGDSVSESIDLGGNVIEFKDDGPDANISSGGTSITIDEAVPSEDELADPFTFGSPLGVASGSLVSAASTALAGADDEGATASLSLSLPANGSSSGLTTTEGQSILLFQENGVITGRADNATGEVVFALSVADNGEVTVAQYQSLNHGDSMESLAASGLSALVTVTDGDGDSTTADIAIGSLIEFRDDSPTTNFSLNGATSVVVDETNVGGTGAVTVAGATLFSTAGTNVGQDEEGSTATYSLEVVDGGNSSLYLTNSATEIILVNNNGVIEGRSGSTVAFTVEIDSTNGDLTLTQLESLDHADSSDNDELLSLASGALNAVLTVTDGDGDIATGSVDLGGNVIGFEDDGPSSSLALNSGVSAVVDESTGADAGEDESSSLGSVTVIGTTLFTASSNTGEDEEGASTTYSLEVEGSGESGLFLTDSSVEIILVNNNGVIEGRSGSTVAFTVEIDASNGDLTLTQLESLDHADTTDNDELLSLASGALNAVLTVTDGDNDIATDSVDLGGNVIGFEDDGPVATISLNADAAIVLDESSLGSVTVTGATLFTANMAVGQDNEGATTGYSLEVVNGGDTGLFLTNSSTEIALVDNNGVIEGRSGSTVAFTVSIDANSGDVTVNQLESLDHPNTSNVDESIFLANGALNAVVTSTDGDDDVATDSVDLGGSVIEFKDDGPSANISSGGAAAITVDEAVPSGDELADPFSFGSPLGVASGNLVSAASAALAGADDEGATATLSLSLPASGSDSGLTTTEGNSIFLYEESGVIVGRESDASGEVVFALSVSDSGEVTVAQYQSINHADSVESLAASGLSALVTVTDGDGDSTTDDVAIGSLIQFSDDGPTANMSLNSGATAIVDETDINSITVSGAALFTTTGTNAGQDQEGATSVYSLEIVGGGNSGLFLTNSSTEITLVDNNGVIEGRSGSTVAFTLEIDASNGDLTLTQFESLDHADTTDNDELLSLASGALNAVLTVTDGDNDVATDSVDLGGNVIGFEDDGPSSSLSLNNGVSVVIDESTGSAGEDESSSLGSVTVTGATLFTATTDTGEDQEGATTVYSLEVNGSGATGLFLTNSSTEITLVDNNGVIEGRSGSTLAFTVEIDASNGDLTLTQLESLNHANTSDNDELLSLASGALNAVLTVTDGDNDVATDSVDLGGNIIGFEDDGPSSSLSLNNGVSVVVDESSGSAGEDESSSLGSVTVTGATLFTATTDTGEDQEGATTVYSLEVDGSGATGLFLTNSSTEVVLVDNNGVIEGRSGSTVAFTVEIDAATGDLSLTQLQSLDHPDSPGSFDEQVSIPNGVLSAVLTVTDGDDDVATSRVDLGGDVIAFEDDGPVATISLNTDASIVLDESSLGSVTVTGAALFTANMAVGQDNEGATTGYSLEVIGAGNTGLFLTNSSTEIILVDNNGVIEGRSGSTVAFTVSIDANSGDVTVNQLESLDHPNTSNVDESIFLANGALNAVVTSTDGDGDVATDSVDLGGSVIEFKDDGPSANISSGGAAAITVDEAVPSGDELADPFSYGSPLGVASGNLVSAASAALAGADDEGATATLSLSLPSSGSDSGLTTTEGNSIFLYEESGVIVGRESDASGEVVFALSVSDSGEVTVAQYQSINHADSVESLAASGLSALVTVTDGDGDSTTDDVAIGSLIQFSDDGPTANLSLNSGATAVVDETDINSITVTGATLFTTTGTNAGQDQEGATSVYSLEIVGGGNSGLFLTNSSTEITLVDNNGVIEGRSGSTVAFTVEIDSSNGDLTLTQLESLDHADTTDNDELLSLASGALNAVLTVTDGDNDIATDSVDLGGNVIGFEDDGPVATISLNTDASIVLDESSLGSVTVTGAALFTANMAVGQDNEGATTGYSLEVIGAGNTGLFLTNSSTEIALVDNNGVIEGRSGSTVAFTVSIDANSGDVTVNQLESLDHPNTSNVDESIFLANDALNAVVTSTDGDGDVATDSVDLGGSVIEFKDDGPSANISSGGAAAITVDETVPSGDELADPFSFGSPLGVASGNLVSAASAALAGADDEDATAKLSLSLPASGSDSGLTTTEGSSIFLYEESGVIVGRESDASGEVVFALSVSDSGEVTVAQYQSINHADSVESLAASGLSALVTVTDGDGDSTTDDVAIGSLIQFSDDGPTANMSLNSGATAIVDETDINSITVSGAALFTTTGTNAGQDQEGATSVYSLEIVDGGNSGLFLTNSSTEITLVDNNGVIEGRSGSTVAFTVEIDASNGDLTLTQLESLNHADTTDNDELLSLASGALNAVLTVTDGDNDVATDSVDLGGNVIGFEDDSPVATISLNTDASIVLDESSLGSVTVTGATLFTANMAVGQDNEGATTGYSLEVVAGGNTGLFLTNSSTEIILVDNNGIIEGRSGSTVAFTVSIDANSGDVTVNQLQSLDHPNTSNVDESIFLANGALNAVVTSTDGDGDVATDSVDLGGSVIEFKDDGPGANISAGGATAITVDEATPSGDELADPFSFGTPLGVASDNLVSAASAALAGADDEGATATLSLSLPTNGSDSGLTTTEGDSIFLYQESDVIVGRETNASGEVVFALSVSDSGEVTVAQYQSINHADSVESLAASGLSALVTVTDGDGDSTTDDVAIGSLIQFSDDGPTANMALNGTPTVVVDETDITNSIIVSGATLFTTTGTNAGQDQESATSVYSLEVVGGGNSGLYLTGSTTEITLAKNNGVIEGRSGSTVAFTVAIDSDNGDLTLTQLESLDHADSTDVDELLSLASGALNAVLTVTDGDNDVATDSVDLGGSVIGFEDDGPSSSLTLNNGVSVVVDESLSSAGEDESSSLGSVTVTGTTLFTAVTATGEDQEGATTVYTLEVDGSGATGLFLTNSSTEIILVNNNGVIEGRSGSTVAFTVKIDAASGDLSLTQRQSLDHPNSPNSFDEQISIPNGVLSAVLTVTDGDDDVASSRVDLGGDVIGFEDDGPVATVSLNADASIVLDESSLGSVTVTGPTLFTANMEVGQDNEGATTAYSLEVVSGGNTGLFITNSSAEIILVENNGVIEGREGGSGGQLAFTVSIDANSGDVTVNQLESLEHPNTSNVDESIFLATGALNAVVTSTDGDGDVATDSVDLGGSVIEFKDDGPTASLELADNVTLVVDETVGSNSGEDESSSLGSVSVAGATLFNAVTTLGQDDEGASTAYSLDVTNGGNTGLFLTGSTAEVVLVENGNTVEGREGGAGGTLAFSVQIDSVSGELTLTQFQSLDHPDTTNNDESLSIGLGILNAVITVTDGDDDVVTDNVDLGAGVLFFEDDGPTIGTNNRIVLDDDNLAGGNSGGTSDDDSTSNVTGTLSGDLGEDGNGSFSLSSMNGTVQTVNGVDVTFTLAGNVLTANDGEQDVFSITVNATNGAYTVNQLGALRHHSDANADDIETDSIFNIAYTVTDGDGDQSTGNLEILIDDDTPTISGGYTDGGIDNDVSFETGASVSGNQGDISIGADQNGSIILGIPGATDTGNTFNNLDVFTDGTIFFTTENAVDGSADLKSWFSNPATDASAVEFYNLSVATDGTYQFDVVNAAEPTPVSFDFGTEASNGTYLNGYTFDVGGDGTNDVIIESFQSDNTEIPTVVSANGIGAGNQNTNAGESLCYTILNGDADSIDIDINYNSQTGSTVEYSYEVFLDGVLVGQGQGFDPSAANYNASLVTTGDGQSLAIDPGARFDQICITYETGTADLNFGNFSMAQVLPPEDQMVNFTVSALDGDGDATPIGGLTLDLIAPDVPIAIPDAQTLETVIDTNLLIELDVSGSMGWDSNVPHPNGGFYTRLAVTQQAIVDLINTYDAAGDVKVNIVTYSSGAQNYSNGWVSASDAITLVNNANPGGGTYYDSALALADNTNFSDPNAIAGAQNVNFFFSDGEPTRGREIGPTEEATWRDWLNGGVGPDTGEGVTSYAIGVGTGVGATQLNPIAYDGVNDVNTDAILVQDFATLSDVLASLANATVTGSVVTNDSGGPDGFSHVNSLTVDGVVYSFDGTTITDPSNNPVGTGSILTIPSTAVLGGELVFDFSNGDYTYTAVPGTFGIETFEYSIEDNNGDTNSSTLSINLVEEIAPVVLDLDGDGLEFLGLDAGVSFDYDQDGVAEQTEWVGADDGLLVYDKNANGIADGAEEISFVDYAEGAETDLEGLAMAFDTNFDGILDENDAEFDSFAIWQDANSDGITDEGELLSLEDAGIESIGLISDSDSYNQSGVSVAGESSYTNTDGTTGTVGDVAFSAIPDAPEQPDLGPTEVIEPMPPVDQNLDAPPAI